MAKVRRVSKAQWLETALELLNREGATALSVDRLARELKTSRSGFYWHFRSRQNLVDAVIQYWAEEFTNIGIFNPDFHKGRPEHLLEKMALFVLDNDLARYEAVMLAWAQADKEVRRRVRKVHQQRLDYIGGLFSQLGFTGKELEMRTRVFVCYQTWETPMFNNVTKTQLRELIKARVRMMVKK